MFSRTTSLTLLFVCLIHAGLIAAVWINAPVAQSLAASQPTVQGVLISLPEPPATPIVEAPPPVVETPPPPPKKPDVPKPKPIEQPKPQPGKPKVAPPPASTPEPVQTPAPVATPTHEPPEQPVQEPRVDASRQKSLAPKYPILSRRLREQGTVFLELLILADGSIAELRVKTSSGYERLDKAALAAVKNWHFVPARRGGEAIAYRYVQPIAFSLEK